MKASKHEPPRLRRPSPGPGALPAGTAPPEKPEPARWRPTRQGALDADALRDLLRRIHALATDDTEDQTPEGRQHEVALLAAEALKRLE